MRIFSYLLIIIGLLMFTLNGMEYQYDRPKDNKGAAAFEVKEGKNDHTFWPSAAAGLILVSGIVFLVRDIRRKKASV